MHESQLAKKVLDVVLERAAAEKAVRVHRVHGWIAETESLSPQSLAFHFAAHAQGTPADGATLDFRLTLIRAQCEHCSTRFAPDHHVTICPTCGSQDATLLGQTGLGIDALEVPLVEEHSSLIEQATPSIHGVHASIEIGIDGPCILAVGSHYKNTVALRVGKHIICSPPIGDLDNALTREESVRAIDELVAFYQADVRFIACDHHPDYASTWHAQVLAKKWNVPIIRVQHHHAHIASAMSEHGIHEKVVGLAWDGTGFGTDGTIWGGEALTCTPTAFHRFGSLRSFPLPGAETAIKNPKRTALGLLHELLGAGAWHYAAAWFDDREQAVLRSMLSNSVNCPRTTSMGRLFDAVAAILNIHTFDNSEGQAAVQLQSAAEQSPPGEPYPIPLIHKDFRLQADWGPLIRAILTDKSNGAPTPQLAARFHASLAALAVSWASAAQESHVVLSGGCFQNQLLTTMIRCALERVGFEVITHKLVPPNDSGIALGQAFVAAATLATLDGTRTKPEGDILKQCIHSVTLEG